MFLTADDFLVPPYSIPDLTGADGNDSSFVDFVEEKEELVLRELLGHDIYDELAEAAVLESYLIETRFANLIDGAYYTSVFSKKQKWCGIKEMLKPYIYSKWLRVTFDSHSRNGIVRAKVENSQVLDPGYRVRDAYNDFAKKAGAKCNARDSLFGYMKSKTAPWSESAPEFENWCWTDPGYETF